VVPRYDPALGADGPKDDEIHVHTIPEFSPLAGHAWLLRHALRDDPPDAYQRDYPWRALRPDGAWAPRLPDPPPQLDFWLPRFPERYPSRRGTAALVAALAVAGTLASLAWLALLVRNRGPAAPQAG
jgi:hypothetical protein